jgi:peptide-methionine (S)-S-oxide reductase
MKHPSSLETITLAGGCFWCVEAVLQLIKGVENLVSGYMGGSTGNPTYQEVCSGSTGHAEVVAVTFDPGVLPLADLLDIFWELHDPTTLNRQGNDIGTQYRSAIFYHSEDQKAAAEASRAAAAPRFKDPIVTEISPAATFYPAEDYHQNYFNLNPQNSYCHYVVGPKVQKFRKKYA